MCSHRHRNNHLFFTKMKEGNISNLILLAVSKVGSRMFRNNTGVGWQGETKRTTTGGLIIDSPRPLRAGLCTGSSDLIGWTPVEITPDMVGRKMAIFTAVEVKKNSGRTSKAQLNFMNRIILDGGIAGVATNEVQAVKLIQNFSRQ